MQIRRRFFQAAVFVLLGISTAAPGLKVLTVQVRSAVVRDRPSFLGRKIGVFPEGTRLTVLNERGVWVQVADAQKRGGWVHKSALTERTLTMRAGRKRVETAASADEVALAGKGFDAPVEREYRRKHPNMSANYRWIDWMEKIVVSSESMAAFIREGALRAGGGR